jgi:hypothetical protein
MESHTLEDDGVMNGENAVENADFHTVSEFMEGIAEREEGSTDYTTSNNGQEAMNADESDAAENAAMDAIVMQMPQTKLDEIAGWFLFRRAGRYC